MATQNFHLPNSLTLDSPNVPFEHINTLADATDSAMTDLEADIKARAATTKMNPHVVGNLSAKTLPPGGSIELLSTTVNIPAPGVYALVGQMTLRASGNVAIEALQLMVDGQEIARRQTSTQQANIGAMEVYVFAPARGLSAGIHTVTLRVISNALSLSAFADNPQITIAG